MTHNAAAREAARHGDGRFGIQPRHDPVGIHLEAVQDPTGTAMTSSDPQALQELLQHPSVEVRGFLASNRSAPPAILEELSHAPEWSVRAGVARNTEVPLHVLERLARDSHEGVRDCAHDNPRLPEKVARELLETDEDSHYHLARNEGVSPRILALLASSDSQIVRAGVADNPSTPAQVLLRLETDPDQAVAKRASARLIAAGL